MKVYAFEFTSDYMLCDYETISFHSTKKGAYRAAIKYMNELWYLERDRHKHIKGLDYLEYADWHVREIEVIED